MTPNSSMGLFQAVPVAIAPAPSPAPELAQRLRDDSSGQLRQEIGAQLDRMQAHLRHRAEKGAHSSDYEQIDAALAAVAAAREILSRMPT